MKAVILAGGVGSRLSEETHLRPKPMVEIGGKPILWHIMKHYSHYGISEFIICLGYKGFVVKEYFANFLLHNSDFTIDVASNSLAFHKRSSVDWKVTLVDTGSDSQTGERLRRVREFVGREHTFCFTYGDGLTDLNIDQCVDFHSKHGKLATMTSVNPSSRYGAIRARNNQVEWFSEKPANLEGRVNGGYFVLNKEIFSYIDDSNVSWEASVLPKLVSQKQLMAFEHDGFWHSMDTIRDRNLLEDIWNSGKASWKT